MILTIVGPNGAGKSTCMRSVMRQLGGFKPIKNDDGKVEGYVSRRGSNLLKKQSVAVVGRYESPTGGCDTIQTKAEIQARVARYAHQYDHVLFEGIIVSTSFGPYSQFLKELSFARKEPHMFAILLPSLEKCIANVQKRRDARGETKPLNPSRCIAYHAYTKRVLIKCEEQNVPYTRLNYGTAAEDVVHILGQHGAKT